MTSPASIEISDSDEDSQVISATKIPKTGMITRSILKKKEVKIVKKEKTRKRVSFKRSSPSPQLSDDD